MHAPLSRILAASLALAGAGGMTASTAASGLQTCGAPGAPHPATPTGAACHLADELEKAFVFPEQGRAYAAMLRRNAAAGRYAAVIGEDAARLLTADLQAVAPDGHLKVRAVATDTRDDAATERSATALATSKYPPLIERAGWIAPGIAFIRINAFMPDPEETAAVAEFMAGHADAEAVIFDIRTHRGGGLEQMDVIFPWLFGVDTRLVTMAMRRSVEEEHGTPFGETASLRLLAGTPQETMRDHWAMPNADTRLRDAKVYLLTSERTGSAAEHFALAMKHTGRATLVGSRTAGANHFGDGIPLPGGFETFMPVGRTFDPVTGKDWEGDGVQPDVAVAPARALEWVLQDLGIASGDAQRLAHEYAPSGSMERFKP